MTWLRRVRSILPWVFQRSTVERRLDDELQIFVEMSEDPRRRPAVTPYRPIAAISTASAPKHGQHREQPFLLHDVRRDPGRVQGRAARAYASK